MSTKRKLPVKFVAQPMVKQSAKALGKGHLDESRTVVSGGGPPIKSNTNGNDVVDISSASSSGDEDEDEDSDLDSADQESADGEDVAMEDADTTAEAPIPEDGEKPSEPSFGDLVRANASEPIDVAGAFEDPSSHAAAFPQGNQIQPPSGASLGTVLAQALKTNDISLLESCLHTTDVNTIRATIQRLDSPLAGILLQKLAERLHRRPGRAGSLMVWVQWTSVTHGGYLATQRDLIKKLADLNRVIDERSKGLQNLLSLKGKLDMLEAQIELRRVMQNQRRQIDEDEEDDEVIYVEGEESEDEDEDIKPQRLASNGDLVDITEVESKVSEDMPMTNGVIADSDDEEEEDSDEDNLLDDEAEETDADTGDEDEIDHDDQDSQEEDDESEDGVQAAPPTKILKTSGLFSRRR
jgi:U3 small nucleolar RNA-associated protein 5